MIDVHAKEVMAWIRRHGFVVSVDLHTPESLVALYDDAYSAGMAQQREADAATLNLTRPQAQLMAGEMTAGEWRTVSAILVNRAKAIREAAK